MCYICGSTAKGMCEIKPHKGSEPDVDAPVIPENTMIGIVIKGDVGSFIGRKLGTRFYMVNGGVLDGYWEDKVEYFLKV